MFKKILRKFGYIKDNNSLVEKMLEERDEYITELKEKESENLKLRATLVKYQYAETKTLPHLDVSMKDPEPLKFSERKEYVGRVAGFYKDVLQKKMYHMIAEQRAQLEQIDIPYDKNGMPITTYNRHEFDLFLKGGINVLWLICDWGDKMIGEAIANQQPISEEERKELEEIAK